MVFAAIPATCGGACNSRPVRSSAHCPAPRANRYELELRTYFSRSSKTRSFRCAECGDCGGGALSASEVISCCSTRCKWLIAAPRATTGTCHILAIAHFEVTTNQTEIITEFNKLSHIGVAQFWSKVSELTWASRRTTAPPLASHPVQAKKRHRFEKEQQSTAVRRAQRDTEQTRTTKCATNIFDERMGVEWMVQSAARPSRTRRCSWSMRRTRRRCSTS